MPNVREKVHSYEAMIAKRNAPGPGPSGDPLAKSTLSDPLVAAPKQGTAPTPLETQPATTHLESAPKQGTSPAPLDAQAETIDEPILGRDLATIEKMNQKMLDPLSAPFKGSELLGLVDELNVLFSQSVTQPHLQPFIGLVDQVRRALLGLAPKAMETDVLEESGVLDPKKAAEQRLQIALQLHTHFATLLIVPSSLGARAPLLTQRAQNQIQIQVALQIANAPIHTQ